MLDTADLAILETYADRMNPVERGLVEEIRRRHDEVSNLQGQLSDAQEEVATLEKRVAYLERAELEADYAKGVAERALEEFKASVRGLVA